MFDIKDVAAMANVSIATVSRYFSAPERLSQNTRDKLKKITDAVGYVPNQMGASLRTRKSNNLVAIMPEISKPVNSAIITALEKEAQKYGYSVLLGDTQGLRERELHYGGLVKRGQADGILLFGASLPFQITEGASAESQFPPMVNVNEMLPEFDINRVVIDNEAAAVEVMEHLFSLGHQRIAAVTGPKSAPSSNDRLAGYKKALLAKDIDVDERMIIQGNYTLKAGEDTALEILKLKNRPTAIFVFNDDMAIGCMKTLKEHGLRIPEDISVFGFDDITYSTYVSPPLTTVHQPLEEIGKACITLLIERIKNPSAPTRKLILDFSLKIRSSTGPCPEQGKKT